MTNIVEWNQRAAIELPGCFEVVTEKSKTITICGDKYNTKENENGQD